MLLILQIPAATDIGLPRHSRLLELLLWYQSKGKPVCIRRFSGRRDRSQQPIEARQAAEELEMFTQVA